MKRKSTGERRRRPPVRSKATVGRVYVAQECFRGVMPHVTLEVNGVEMPLSKSFKRKGLIHFHFKKPAPNTPLDGRGIRVPSKQLLEQEET